LGHDVFRLVADNRQKREGFAASIANCIVKLLTTHLTQSTIVCTARGKKGLQHRSNKSNISTRSAPINFTLQCTPIPSIISDTKNLAVAASVV
jgi:hypothetical protein